MHFAFTLPLALAAALLDVTLGYPLALYRVIGHPVVWMRAWSEALLSAAGGRSGGVTLALYLAPALVVPVALMRLGSGPVGFVVTALIASTLISQQALDRRVRVIITALERDDLETARENVAALGSPDTGRDSGDISQAALEAIARQFARGVAAPLFWIAIAGLPGGAAYKALEVARARSGAPLLTLLGAPGDVVAGLSLAAAARSKGARGGSIAPRAFTLANWPPAVLAQAVEGERPAAAALRSGLALYRRAAAIEILVLMAAAILAVAWRA